MQDEGQNIEQLYRETFESFEAEVPSNAWANIQQGLQQAPATGSVSSAGSASGSGTGSTVLGLSKAGLAILAVVSAVVIAAVTIVATNDDQAEPVIAEEVVVEPEAKTTVNTASVAEADLSKDIEVSASTASPVLEEAEGGEPRMDASGLVAKVSQSTPNNEAPEQSIVTETNPLEASSSVAANPTQEIPDVEPAAVPVPADDSVQEDEILEDVQQRILESLRASIAASPIGGRAPLVVNFSIDLDQEVKEFNWDFGDGIVTDQATPQHTFWKSGTYEVRVELMDARGQRTNALTTIEVLPSREDVAQDSSYIIVPNVLTPNGDGVNDQFAVVAENISSYQLIVYSLSGAIVFESDNPTAVWEGRDQSGALPNGVYFVQVIATGKDGKKYIEKKSVTLRR